MLGFNHLEVIKGLCSRHAEIFPYMESWRAWPSELPPAKAKFTSHIQSGEAKNSRFTALKPMSGIAGLPSAHLFGVCK